VVSGNQPLAESTGETGGFQRELHEPVQFFCFEQFQVTSGFHASIPTVSVRRKRLLPCGSDLATAVDCVKFVESVLT
jgi:hypothetical protein